MKPCSLGFIYDSSRSKLLLIKRSDLPIWVLPGGGIDEGETPMDAAGREVLEEAGVKAAIHRLASLYQPKNSLSSTTYIFEGDSSDVPKAGEEARDAKFFPIEELPRDLFVLHAIWIERILKEPGKVHEGLITEITVRRVLTFFIKRPGILIKYAWNRLFRKEG